MYIGRNSFENLRRVPGSSVRIAGTTLSELAVYTAIFSLFVGIVQAFYLCGYRASALCIESNDAVRSAILALESIRRDASHLVYGDPQDLIIRSDGRGLGMLVPTLTERDLWSVGTRSVQYHLQAVGSTGRVFRLMRRIAGRESSINGCLLRELHVSCILAGQASALQGYLQVTVTGAGSVNEAQLYTASEFIPIRRALLPPGYRYSAD